ncbi:hypothetical protein, partial [Cognatilysobacter lacus]
MPEPFERLRALLEALPLQAWLALAAVLVVQRFARRLGLWAYAAFALPGTIAHELAHYVIASILAAQPHLPRLWPERREGRWELGSV